ncbi:MAG: phenylphosphate carboxylase subunit delta [Gemmatimonadota bacterium]|nr:phenylphosphate carboxylase subunit delta [Gemmatimonadota bacterium]
MTPAIDPDVAAGIRLVSLDVDGVLTDGSLFVSVGPDGAVAELRRFHVLDGMGIRLLREAGLRVAFVSGKRSDAVAARAAELGVEDVHLGDPAGKLATVRGILSRHGWDWEAVAHLADDLADMTVLDRAGLPAAVPNAVEEVRAVADWIGTVPGGRGAVREFAEALLAARGQWEDLVREFREGGRFAGPDRGEDPGGAASSG